MSVMVLQGRKSSSQKSRPLESGHRRHAVWIAIEYSYKLGQKNEFKFLYELGWFSQTVTFNQLSEIALKLMSSNIVAQYSYSMIFKIHGIVDFVTIL